MLIAATKAAVANHNDRLEQRNVKIKSRTADSAMLNRVPGQFNRLLVDEGNMIHWGQLVAIASMHSIRKVVIMGDPKQISFISFLAGHEARWHLPPMTKTLNASVSSRINPFAAAVLRRTNYETIDTTNKNGGIEFLYDLSELKLRETDDIVVMTQADKRTLHQQFPNLKKNKNSPRGRRRNSQQ